jgi:hypothetical protein
MHTWINEWINKKRLDVGQICTVTYITNEGLKIVLETTLWGECYRNIKEILPLCSLSVTRWALQRRIYICNVWISRLMRCSKLQKKEREEKKISLLENTCNLQSTYFPCSFQTYTPKRQQRITLEMPTAVMMVELYRSCFISSFGETWDWLNLSRHLFYLKQQNQGSLHSRCAIKYIARTFPKKSDRLSFRKGSLHGGGGMFELKRRQQQQQVGPQTGRQTDEKASSRRHCRPRCSATMPHRKYERTLLPPASHECDTGRTVRDSSAIDVSSFRFRFPEGKRTFPLSNNASDRLGGSIRLQSKAYLGTFSEMQCAGTWITDFRHVFRWRMCMALPQRPTYTFSKHPSSRKSHSITLRTM